MKEKKKIIILFTFVITSLSAFLLTRYSEHISKAFKVSFATIFTYKAANAFYNNYDLTIKPISFNEDLTKKLISITPSASMEGKSGENNLLRAIDTGSYMFGKDGINLFIGGSGVDHFGFSMCSTKVINNHVSEIQDFETGRDIINIFCTKDSVKKEYITIDKKIVNSHTYNFITIKMLTGEPSVFAVDGDVSQDDIQIITKEVWDDLAGSVNQLHDNYDF